MPNRQFKPKITRFYNPHFIPLIRPANVLPKNVIKKEVILSFLKNGLKSSPGTCECATASKEAVMSAIEKLCLSSSANDFHVSLDIIFWREGSFFNYAGASFAH